MKVSMINTNHSGYNTKLKVGDTIVPKKGMIVPFQNDKIAAIYMEKGQLVILTKYSNVVVPIAKVKKK